MAIYISYPERSPSYRSLELELQAVLNIEECNILENASVWRDQAGNVWMQYVFGRDVSSRLDILCFVDRDSLQKIMQNYVTDDRVLDMLFRSDMALEVNCDMTGSMAYPAGETVTGEEMAKKLLITAFSV